MRRRGGTAGLQKDVLDRNFIGCLLDRDRRRVLRRRARSERELRIEMKRRVQSDAALKSQNQRRTYRLAQASASSDRVARPFE